MTHRRDLERHRRSLTEIRNIMNSMKTLAWMETRKLSRFLDAQRAVVQGMEEVATDLLCSYPEILPVTGEATPLYLLVGTERGFCGDFNQAVVRGLETRLATDPPVRPLLIATGRKLGALLEGDTRVAATYNGASIAEEITPVLHQVVSELVRLFEQHGELTVSCIYHRDENHVVMQRLLPAFLGLQAGPARHAFPPVLNHPPRQFLTMLADHYLPAALHEMLYNSLMVENQYRLTHLDGAVKHLDHKSAALARQCNALRQEEIIEEIEVILLGSTGPEAHPEPENRPPRHATTDRAVRRTPSPEEPDSAINQPLSDRSTS
jgi:F-type H+-transporting ATPase subunit gamma